MYLAMSVNNQGITEKNSLAEKFKNEANEFFKSKDWCYFIVFLYISKITWKMWIKKNITSKWLLNIPNIDKEYDKAIDMYTKAIELDPKNAVYFANRSLAHLRQESFGSALEDGILAVKNDPTYLKVSENIANIFLQCLFCDKSNAEHCLNSSAVQIENTWRIFQCIM